MSKTFKMAPYYYFYQQLIQEYQDKENPPSRTLIEQEASRRWDAMSQTERTLYKEHCRQYNKDQKFATIQNKKTQPAESSEEGSLGKNMKLYVTMLLNRIGSDRITLVHHDFVVAAVNILCEQGTGDNKVYYPYELALAKFSVSCGVKGAYTVLINPGQIDGIRDKQYPAFSQGFSEKALSHACTDYDVIVREMKAFLGSSSVVFCRQSELSSVFSSFNVLQERASSPSDILTMDIYCLVHNLLEQAGQKANYSDIRKILYRQSTSYVGSCATHRLAKKASFCAATKALDLAFASSKRLAEQFMMIIHPGKHFPTVEGVPMKAHVCLGGVEVKIDDLKQFPMLSCANSSGN